MKQNIIGAICLTLAASLWGGMYVISKYVLNYIPPLTLVWLRYAIAFVVLFAVMKFIKAKNHKRKGITKRDWGLLAWIGFIGYFLSKIIGRTYRCTNYISYTGLYCYFCKVYIKRKTDH